ncbi:uncharacterized protein N7459_003492 [Penicillium hispanicum]|uniref:uncharacterized protein n=1 Tax=Penicillium hispanicum TaxID=1080232 RepID=UPI002540E227|nr:uncharacterized protein N7459_003492 [Penicillium hispanicum]KAJ5587727.1 hypothetical protein N7459_003492 [Penicillium hispanicum]
MPERIFEPAQREIRVALMAMHIRVRDFGVDEFDLKQLEDLNVRVDPMVLDETSPQKPSYFAAQPSHLILETNEETLGSYNGLDDMEDISPAFKRPYDIARQMNWFLVHYISRCRSHANDEGESDPWRYNYGGDFPECGLFKYEQPEFGCFRILDLKDPAYPHVKAIIYNNMVATESTILYGELLPILRLMFAQFRRKRLRHHMMAPVLVISLMGVKCRAIEAHFDGKTLTVRPSAMYDFTHGNDAAFRTFAQWFLGKAIGDTLHVP